MNEPSITTTGGFQYNIGAMYFFKAFKKGYGLTFQLKYDNKTFNNDTKLTNNTETKEHTDVGSFIVAMGMRI